MKGRSSNLQRAAVEGEIAAIDAEIVVTGDADLAADQRDAAGKVSELTMTPPAAQPVSAIRIDAYDTRAITFTNGAITLAGDVLRPRSNGSHAAAVVAMRVS